MGTEGIQDKYVNPYTDFGFKLLFGTVMDKGLLISFLNALLFGEETVKDVTYLNTEHLGTQEYDRRAIFDVYCENEKGEKFLVEMQRGEQQFFKDRSLYYSSFPIREQGKRGPWDYELKAVYVMTSSRLFIWKCRSSANRRRSWRRCSTSGFSCSVTFLRCSSALTPCRNGCSTICLKLPR